MIRIAHTSDLHIDERHRPEDTVLVLSAFVHQAHDAGADLIVVAGDHFERRSTPLERNILAEFLQDASGVGPVACVKGNHDAAEDLDIFARLEAHHPVRVFDRPTSAPCSAWVLDIKDGARVGILALPWFDKVHLVAGLDATVDAEQTRQTAIATAGHLLTFLRAEAERLRSEGCVPILVGHVQVAGSEVASGQTLIGTSVELSPADLLDVHASYCALGHIHMSQQWFGGRVAYSGSPNRCNFGEHEPKGWRLVTLTDSGDFVSNEFKELPARRMVLMELDFNEQISNYASLNAIRETDVRGAVVRFRYRIRAEQLHTVDEAGIVNALTDAGAWDVKLEAIVEAETRVRSEEIVHLRSTADKVDAFWRSKGIDVDDPTRDRVFGNLAELEAN